jgi:hypothetical protein
MQKQETQVPASTRPVLYVESDEFGTTPVYLNPDGTFTPTEDFVAEAAAMEIEVPATIVATPASRAEALAHAEVLAHEANPVEWLATSRRLAKAIHAAQTLWFADLIPTTHYERVAGDLWTAARAACVTSSVCCELRALGGVA